MKWLGKVFSGVEKAKELGRFAWELNKWTLKEVGTYFSKKKADIIAKAKSYNPKEVQRAVTIEINALEAKFNELKRQKEADLTRIDENIDTLYFRINDLEKYIKELESNQGKLSKLIAQIMNEYVTSKKQEYDSLHNLKKDTNKKAEEVLMKLKAYLNELEELM